MDIWITAIVPVYNVIEYLDRCVKSILAQMCTQLQIILVDDESTDGSAALCDKLANKYECISVIHKPNGGLASARNAGLEYARGKYIAFVDSDDWLEPETFLTLKTIADKYEMDILTFGYQKVYDSKVCNKEWAAFPEGIYGREQIRTTILPDSIAREKAFDQVNLPVQLSACMNIYRTDFLKRNNLRFFSERIVLNEDWLFNIACLCRADTLYISHHIFYNYFTRTNSLSMTYKQDAYERKKKLYNSYIEELETTGNLNAKTAARMKNFWMEGIYCCYIIEQYAPKWSVQRAKKLCGDTEFFDYVTALNLRNATLKGILFSIIVKYNLHYIMRMAYLCKMLLCNK